MPANIRETSIAFGKKKQSALATANVLADLWKLDKVNASLADVRLNTESNAGDIGKGHEWETQSFLTNWDIAGSIEKYATSEFATWAFAYALGKVTKSGSGPYVYTITPADPVNDGIELPSFSFLEAIRQGGSAVLDRMAVGCVVESLDYTLETGPTRAAHKLVAGFVGSGKLTEPSGITHPAATTEHRLPQASAAITINSVNYVSSKNIVSFRLGYRNNHRLDSGYYPGSGTQSGAAIRGRMEFGDRSLTASFVARFENGSAELTKLKNQTSGTATIQVTYDANEDLLLTLQQVVFRTAVINDTNGIVTVAVEIGPQYHSSNGLLTVVGTTAVNNICQ